TAVSPLPVVSGRQAPLPRSHTAGTCCPVAGSNMVWPLSHERGPVQPWATKSMLLVWNCTPEVGMVLCPAGPTTLGQPGVFMLLLAVQLGSTQNVLSSS